MSASHLVVPETDGSGRFYLDLYEPPPITEEEERQARIAAGEEHACAACGCSESRACEGGCVWATETLCSRCV